MQEGRRPRGVTPRPRSGAAAKSARLRRCRKGQEELPHAQGQGIGRDEQPHIQGAVAARAQEGLEELFHIQGRRGGMGRYPSFKVRSSGCTLLE